MVRFICWNFGQFLFFSFIEAFILMSSGTIKLNTEWRNLAQVALLFFNVILTLATTILFTIYPEFYEFPAHCMEYAAQILISFVNFLFFISNLKNKSKNRRIFEGSVVVISILMSIFNVLIYSAAIPTESPERSAHFFEFVNELINASFALSYATLIYKNIDGEIEEHFHAMHKTP